MKKKKIILGLTTISTIVAPLVTVISCGNEKEMQNFPKAKLAAIKTIEEIKTPTKMDFQLHDTTKFAAIAIAKQTAIKEIIKTKDATTLAIVLVAQTTAYNQAIFNYKNSTGSSEDVKSVKSQLENKKYTKIVIPKDIVTINSAKNEIINNLNSFGIDLNSCTLSVVSIGSLKQDEKQHSDIVIKIAKNNESQNFVLNNVIWEETQWQIKEDVLYVKEKLEKMKFLVPKFITKVNKINTFIIEKSKILGIDLRGCSIKTIIYSDLKYQKDISISINKKSYFEETKLFGYFNTFSFDIDDISKYINKIKYNLIEVSSAIESSDIAAESIRLQLEFILLKQFPILKGCSIEITSNILKKSPIPFSAYIKISKEGGISKFVSLNNISWN